MDEFANASITSGFDFAFAEIGVGQAINRKSNNCLCMFCLDDVFFGGNHLE